MAEVKGFTNFGLASNVPEASEARSTSQYCTVIGQHSGSVVK